MYGTINVEAIHKNCYTAKKHKKFMKTFGCLVEDIRIESIGKTLTILTPTLLIIRRLIIAVTIT